ncbi:MAG TPA: flagellar motor protein MotB [Thioalkalivibrio sp.]|nr:flagellar motor protein MotB [Thioalkalivibrio sp.]
MALDDKKQPIVVKKIIKKGGHHGGAWKIAFADFATAMMAFFLLLWILGVTDDDQKAAISEYFQNPSAFMGTSSTPAFESGTGTGASPSLIDFEGAIDMAPEQELAEMDADTLEELAEQQEKERLETLMEALEEAMDRSQALEPFKDQLLLDITPEGLRIQIVDKENRPMFDLGGARLRSYSIAILQELGGLVNQVPNKISITGHTDARPFLRPNYSNWELSSDRANAARRALVAGGMEEAKIGRVIGLASTVLFDKTEPQSPINRRISIIVMTKETEEAIQKESEAAAYEMPQ